MSNHPPAVGCQLTNEEVEKLAEARYRRFHWEYGRPLWNEPHMERIRLKFIRETREVVDAMEISGMKIQKDVGLPDKADKLFSRHKGAALETVPTSKN